MSTSATPSADRAPASYGAFKARQIQVRTVLALVALGVLPGLLFAVVKLPAVGAIAIEALAIGTILLLDRRVTETLGRRARGNAAEREVGSILEAMQEKG